MISCLCFIMNHLDLIDSVAISQPTGEEAGQTTVDRSLVLFANEPIVVAAGEKAVLAKDKYDVHEKDAL